jgi:hypothetical protein
MAASLDDFERSTAGFTALAPAEAAIVPAPAGGGAGNALRLSWPDKHGLWIEGWYGDQEKHPVAEVVPGVAAVLRCSLWFPPATAVRNIGVRLFDAHREIWQWTAEVTPPPAGGWIPEAIPLALDRANHWGGDGIPDLPLRLGGYSVLFANERVPAGQVVIDQVTCESLLAVRIATDRFPFLVDAPGGHCDLILANRQPRELTVTVDATAKDWEGQRSDQSGQFTLAPGAEARLPLPLSAHPGHHALTWSLQCDGLAFSGSGSVALTAPVPLDQHDSFRFGISSHPESKPVGDQEREMLAAAAVGATVLRCGVAWNQLAPKAGEWQWEVQDRLVDLATRAGLEIQLVLGFCPEYAASAGLRAAQAEAYRKHEPEAWKITCFAPPDQALWRAYVAAVATRYPGRIRMYEVWNEPDLGFFRGTTDEYIRLVRTAAEEVHRVDPAAQVLTGGFATVLSHPGRARNPDLQERVLREASADFDIHAVHQHGPFAEFKPAVEGELRRLRAAMSTPRPLYFNETAMCAYGGDAAAQRMQAAELVKKMAWVKTGDAIGYTWYDLRNDGANPREPEHQYGLLTWDFSPNPAFCAYAEVVRRLRGARHLGDLDLGAGRYGLVFSGLAGRVAVLWREDAQQPDEPLAVRVEGPARLVDVQGGGVDLAVRDGVTLLHLGSEPQYLELPPGETLPEVVPLLRLRGANSVAPGQAATFVAMARNPWSTPIDLQLTWSDPVRGKVAQALTVPGNAAAELPLTVAIGTGGSPAVTLGWQVAAWHGELRQPLQVTRDIAAQPPVGRAPDLILDQRSDVTNLCGNDPALSAHVWQGPDDLSARVWWWRTPVEVHVQIEVRDDTHTQVQKPADQWRGDGVQFALQVPGRAGYWELGVARRSDDGTVMRAAWVVPPGERDGEQAFTATVDPVPGGLRYHITLPCARFGLDAAALSAGFRFNLIANDNDGGVREGWVQLAPGIGESKDPKAFPWFRGGAIP